MANANNRVSEFRHLTGLAVGSAILSIMNALDVRNSGLVSASPNWRPRDRVRSGFFGPSAVLLSLLELRITSDLSSLCEVILH